VTGFITTGGVSVAAQLLLTLVPGVEINKVGSNDEDPEEANSEDEKVGSPEGDDTPDTGTVEGLPRATEAVLDTELGSCLGSHALDDAGDIMGVEIRLCGAVIVSDCEKEELPVFVALADDLE
jgi:hypothetical protein